MLSTVIDGFVSQIISDITGFTADNCKGYDNEEVFDYIITNSLSPNPQQGVIVGYGGARESRMPSEFGGLVIDWIIIVSALFPLSGNIDDENAQLENAYAFVDDIVASIITDPTLGGAAMDVRLIDAEPPMEYLRNGVTTYLLISMRFAVTENLD